MGWRRFLRLAFALVLAGLSTGLILLVWGNGITASGLALSCLMLSTALGAFVRRPAERRARLAWCVGVAGGCVGFLTFIASRLWTEPEPQSFRFVESGRRDAAPPWLSRLVDERETVLTGLRFSNLLGMIRGREMEHLDLLLRQSYSHDFEPWPNAALINALPTLPRHLEHLPSGGGRFPCLVFLHGFGGQLTGYLRVLEQAFGERYVIVAPFLDFTGAFWSERGKAAVNALVTKHLPPEVDRERIFLVGLSNGAIGTTAILQDPEMAPLFRGFVLVSGSGEVQTSKLLADVLMISGSEDQRFPLAYNEGIAEALRGSGAHVETLVLPADHFIWFSHSRLMSDAIEHWVSKR